MINVLGKTPEETIWNVFLIASKNGYTEYDEMEDIDKMLEVFFCKFEDHHTKIKETKNLKKEEPEQNYQGHSPNDSPSQDFNPRTERERSSIPFQFQQNPLMPLF